MRRNRNRERDEMIRDMRKGGKTLTEIARRVGLGTARVSNICRANGWTAPRNLRGPHGMPPRWTPERDERLLDMMADNHPTSLIAKVLGVGEQAVRARYQVLCFPRAT